MKISNQKLVVGNWKMHKTIAETGAFIEGLKPLLALDRCLPALAVPFTALAAAAQMAAGSPIVIGAQNVYFEPKGAFTGEISVEMLKDAGARFVIVGHSERRWLFHESSEVVNAKVKSALAENLQPIVCFGETLQHRQDNDVESFLYEQLTQTLQGLTEEQLSKLILAYEPVWAIGTQQVATIEIIQAVFGFCREFLAKMWGDAASNVAILYGGSVTTTNCKALLDHPAIGGLLVGGASLQVQSFATIVNHKILSGSLK